ncbi:MAG: hypothetical protein IJT56_11710 [Clostridia bacterium]|nr:hypothetical protein [Clostridia bacterium]
MNTKKHFLTWIALTAVICSALAACGEEGGQNPGSPAQTASSAETTAAETEAEETKLVYAADIPEGTDFGGYNFRFLHWYHDSWQERINKDLVAEEMNGETLNDAVYTRNMNVSEALNINITSELMGLGEIATAVNKAVSAGEDAWDAVYIRLYEVPSSLSSGIFMNYFNIPTIDFENPWWDHNSVEQLSIDHKLFLVASDINIIDKNATAGLAFNKQMAVDYSLPDLYQTVRDGKWTMDYMMSLYQNASRDIDGDGKMGLDDIYGFLSKNDAMTFFFHGSGGRFISKDSEDIPYFSFPGEKNFTVTQKLFDMFSDENNFFNQHVWDTSVVTDAMYTQMFANGQGLFFLLRLDDIEFMRSSDTDFGVLPITKYDETQSDYYSTVSQHTSGLMSIPITVSDMERDGIILEALAAESKNLVQPAYYEINMTTKYTRDTESGEMLELIMANRVYDLGCIYSFGDFANQYQNMGSGKKNDIASMTAKSESKVAKAIDKVVAKYADLG